jgi:hypothetical protein
MVKWGDREQKTEEGREKSSLALGEQQATNLFDGN